MWIKSTTFPPSSWCQYDLKIRTNNSIEGWHRGLFQRMGPRPPFYSFLAKLRFDAETIIDIIRKGDFNHRLNDIKKDIEKNSYYYRSIPKR